MRLFVKMPGCLRNPENYENYLYLLLQFFRFKGPSVASWFLLNFDSMVEKKFINFESGT